MALAGIGVPNSDAHYLVRTPNNSKKLCEFCKRNRQKSKAGWWVYTRYMCKECSVPLCNGKDCLYNYHYMVYRSLGQKYGALLDDFSQQYSATSGAGRQYIMSANQHTSESVTHVTDQNFESGSRDYYVLSLQNVQDLENVKYQRHFQNWLLIASDSCEGFFSPKERRTSKVTIMCFSFYVPLKPVCFASVSSNWIFRLSVRNSVPPTYKVQYFKL